MPLRLPKANTWFQAQTDANLATYGQAIHDGLVASVADFPTPPVPVTALQTQINSYVTALSLATGPGAGKINTANKNTQKALLQSYLRQNARYVNQIIVGTTAAGGTYEAAQAMIIGTGYQLSADPAPAGPLPPPTPIKNGSYTKGQYYILVGRVPNAKGYLISISDVTTGLHVRSEAFPNTRITISDLISGHSYNFRISSIGASPANTFSEILEAIII